MKALEVDVNGIEEHGIIADIGSGLKLDLIYNNQDSFLYASIMDDSENRITGFFRIVPNIDLLSLSRNEVPYQIRCIKINDYAEERDKVTPSNLNRDYKFFLIGEDE